MSRSTWAPAAPSQSAGQLLERVPPRSYLVEVVEGFVEVGMHPSRGLIGDFDGVLQDALGNDVAVRGGGWLRADEDTEIRVAALTVLLQLLLQRTQPLGHEVDVLSGAKGTRPHHQTPVIYTCAEQAPNPSHHGMAPVKATL